MSEWLSRDLDLKVAAALQLSMAEKHDFVPYFVTISREYGCDGLKFAEALAEKLNQRKNEIPWTIYDRHSLLKVSGPDQLTEEMMNLLDNYGHSEFRGYIQEAIFGKTNQFQIIQNLGKLIRMLARRGHVILVGRGGQVLTRDMQYGLHLRLYAREPWRMTNHVKRNHGGDPDACHHFLENQQKRDTFVETYLNESIRNPELYHLMINNEKVPLEKAVQMALSLIPKE